MIYESEIENNDDIFNTPQQAPHALTSTPPAIIPAERVGPNPIGAPGRFLHFSPISPQEPIFHTPEASVNFIEIPTPHVHRVELDRILAAEVLREVREHLEPVPFSLDLVSDTESHTDEEETDEEETDEYSNEDENSPKRLRLSHKI